MAGQITFPATADGVSENERGTSNAPFLVAQAAPSAGCTYFINPDMIQYSSPRIVTLTRRQTQVLGGVFLSAEEQADNIRYESVMRAAPMLPPSCMGRVSYWWPASFFQQNGQQVHLTYQTTPGLSQGDLVGRFYPKMPTPTLTKFGRQGTWFKMWHDSDLKPGFIFRKGDVINFGGGHTTIVVGDNTYNDAVVSQMSYNRTRQTYQRAQTWEDEFPQGQFDHYGVTRDKVSDLRNGLGPARIGQAFTARPYYVYRLMPWLKAPDPQFFQLNQLTTQAQNAYRRYTVVKGDTLSRIAEKPAVQSTVSALAEANGIPDPNWIQVGDVLLIP